MKRYPPSEKSTFAYWFAHWRAFNKTAWRLGVWRPKYLFHDIEKPFLMWLWKDYPRVQKWHRTHNSHHWEYNDCKGPHDWLAMVIDWECSPMTKEACPWGARDKFNHEIEEYGMTSNYGASLCINMHPILEKLGL